VRVDAVPLIRVRADCQGNREKKQEENVHDDLRFNNTPRPPRVRGDARTVTARSH
jgi:hypothetical protein